MRQRIKDSEIEKDIIRVKELVGKLPTQENYKKYGSFAINSILLRKSWNEWLKELFNETNIGTTYENVNKVSEEDLIKNLIELSNVLNRQIEQKDLSLGKYGIGPYLRVFGKFSNAMDKANIQYEKRYGIEDSEILEDIRRVSVELGRIPTMNEFRKLNKTVSSVSVSKRFGSWNKAIELSGLFVSTNHIVTKDDVKLAICEWVVKNNNNLSCLKSSIIKQAKEENDFPYCLYTIFDKFNNATWEEIMKECGFLEYENVTKFIKRGRFPGFDGIIYSSLIEKQIGDYLYNLKNDNMIEDYFFKYLVIDDTCCDFFIKLKNKDMIVEIDVNNMQGKLDDKIVIYKNKNYNYCVIGCGEKEIKNTLKSIFFKK